MGAFLLSFSAGLLARKTKTSRRPAGRPAGRKPCPIKVCEVAAGLAGLLAFASTFPMCMHIEQICAVRNMHF